MRGPLIILPSCKNANGIFFVLLMGCLFLYVNTTTARKMEVPTDSLIKVYDRADNDSAKSMLCLDIAGIFFSKNSTGPLAKQWLLSATRHANKSGSKSCRGYCYVYDSYVLVGNQMDVKTKYLDSAMAMFRPSDFEGQAFAEHMKMRYDQDRGQKDADIEDLKRLKRLLELSHADDNKWATFYYSPLAFLEYGDENYEDAGKDFRKSYELLISATATPEKQYIFKTAPGYFGNSYSIMASTANNLGLCYYKLDSMSKAIQYYKRGMEKFAAVEDHPGLAWTYQLIGECYAGLGMPNEATPWILKTIDEIKLISSSSSSFNQAGDYSNAMDYLCNILFQAGRYPLLITHIDSAYDYILKVHDNTGKLSEKLAFLLLQKAKAYACMKRDQEIPPLLDQAKPFVFLAENNGGDYSDFKYSIKTNYAQYYMLQAWLAHISGNASGYAGLRDKSLGYIKDIDDWAYRVDAYSNVKWFMVQAHDYKNVIIGHSACYRHLHDKKDMVKELNFTGELATAYAATGLYDSAYKYKDIYAMLNDSIRGTQQYYALAELTDKYKTEAEKAELIYQSEQAAKRHFQNIIFLISGIIALVLVSIILLLNRQRLINQHSFEKAEKEKLLMATAQQQKELSNTTLELVKSNNAFEGLLHEVENIGKNVKGDNRHHLKKLVVNQKFASQEESWRQFNMQFEKMNSGFYQSLMKLQPSLTESEKKICALMALGLSNKEISAVTFQSINSVYTYKNRLRKKFSYTNDEDLAESLSKLLSN